MLTYTFSTCESINISFLIWSFLNIICSAALHHFEIWHMTFYLWHSVGHHHFCGISKSFFSLLAILLPYVTFSKLSINPTFWFETLQLIVNIFVDFTQRKHFSFFLKSSHCSYLRCQKFLFIIIIMTSCPPPCLIFFSGPPSPLWWAWQDRFFSQRSSKLVLSVNRPVLRSHGHGQQRHGLLLWWQELTWIPVWHQQTFSFWFLFNAGNPWHQHWRQ